MSNKPLSPLHRLSPRELFRERLQAMILDGELGPGQRLPAERELAQRLGVSRPVVHEALRELEARGLLRLRPRQGALVHDIRRHGSLGLLQALVGELKPRADHPLLLSLLDLWELINRETVVLAARRRQDSDLRTLKALLTEEEATPPEDVETLSRIDFDFYHGLALASGNLVYPLLMRSCEQATKTLCEPFYKKRELLPALLAHHRAVTAAVEASDERAARAAMDAFLAFGREELLLVLRAGAEGTSLGRGQS